MINVVYQLGPKSLISTVCRNFSVSAVNNKAHSCKLLVVGGGSGGCTIAAKFARKLKKGEVIILEPSSDHYYQPLWTLVGAGVTSVAATRRPTQQVLPTGATWLQDAAEAIDPAACRVTTQNGDVISYEYLVVAVGLKNDYTKIPGLQKALDDENSGVSTIYSPRYCEKTFSDLQKFKGGDAVFTYPECPIKCPGAPQKIAYMADAYFTKTGIRSTAKITYNTCLPVIFGVKKYADSLLKVAERKNIRINYRTILSEVRPDKKEAVFMVCDGEKKTEMTMPYDLLHVTPHMAAPKVVSSLADSSGLVDVDKHTLRHSKHHNVFGIGDCTNTPNSKTAAAIAKQSYVLEQNLLSTMSKRPLSAQYDGYGACPLVTSYNTCILAEFIYNGVVHETFPFDQSKERIIAYYMKRDLFPFIYWNFMLKGWYHGPEFVRKIINPTGN